MERLLAEDLMLLTRGDNGKQLMDGGVRDRGVAGALLADLAAGSRLNCLDERLVVVTDKTPTGQPPLDKVLQQISVSGRDRSPRGWVSYLASPKRAGELRRLLALRRSTPDYGYVPALRASIVAQLGEVFASGTEPGPRTAALAALVAACGVSGKLFPNVDRRVRKRRLAEISAGQWAASGVRNSIRARSLGESAVWLPIAIILDGLG
ncbi:MAG TPA: GPP34 family phosphoprotein [Streptosporangiaceae bacterium]|nr:GPP34 family phosphoprotein [Streptosporangiaceae bacterium]